jgi:cytochrome c biogenesis protein CcmG/thiol:disulfide interchange protein DsbE
MSIQSGLRRLVPIVAAACLALGTAALAADTPNASGAPVGSTAPGFAARSLEGRPLGPADFGGKVLVLNFWATWCPPCREETADLIKAFGQLHAADVAFLGVDTTETAPVVKTFLSVKGVPYQTVLAGPDAYNRFGIAYIPTTVVVDAHGIVRARWVGGVSPDRLRSYIDSARAGHDALFLSEEQRKIDALLDPKQFTFAGDSATVTAALTLAKQKLDEASAYTDQLDASQTPLYDDERTSFEEGNLELAAANAMESQAQTPAEHLAVQRLRGKAYGQLNRWADAANLYRTALATSVGDPALSGALVRAYYRLHDYDAMAASARAWVKLAPNDADANEELGLAEQRGRHYAAAVAPYRTSLATLMADARSKPIGKDGEAVASVADESLDLADVYVSLGDAAGARRTFAQAQKYAHQIPARSRFASLIARTDDRTVEGMAAVTLAHAHGTTLSLVHWTGADLPGSLKTTYKYRLIVVAPANHNVTLATRGVRPGWVASFCADGLCSPKTVSFMVPPSGVKTYEFQLVPPTVGADPGRVAVGATSAKWAAIP